MADARRTTPSDPRILLWMPLPPPFAGPEVASELLARACCPYLPGVTVENATVRASNMAKGRLDWAGLTAFARSYRRFLQGTRDSDVVYLVMAANTIACLRDAVLIGTARLMGKQVVIHLRGGRYGDYYRESSGWMKRVLRFSWGSATRAIVQTPRLEQALEAAAPHVTVDVIPNGLPSGWFEAKRSYASNRPRILFLGHLTHPKGFHDLIAAFRQVRARWPEATLVCAGELPRDDRALASFLPKHLQAEYLLRRRAICSDIVEFVHGGSDTGVEYAGIVEGEAKHALLASADLFVLPSYTEGFSLALLEAMFHGLPIITTRVGGSPDIVKEGENGLLIEPGDIDALAHALDRLIGDPQLRETLGTHNAREARARYDLEIVAQQLAQVLVRAWADRK